MEGHWAGEWPADKQFLQQSGPPETQRTTVVAGKLSKYNFKEIFDTNLIEEILREPSFLYWLHLPIDQVTVPSLDQGQIFDMLIIIQVINIGEILNKS